MAQDMSGLISRRGDDSSLELSPSVVYIEACENFQKQSYRNRCRFYGAEGVQTLSFPIVHDGGTHKHSITEVRIDYKTPWVQQHEKAIISAYGMSAYFEYYQDELFSIMESKPSLHTSRWHILSPLRSSSTSALLLVHRHGLAHSGLQDHSCSRMASTSSTTTTRTLQLRASMSQTSTSPYHVTSRWVE